MNVLFNELLRSDIKINNNYQIWTSPNCDNDHLSPYLNYFAKKLPASFEKTDFLNDYTRVFSPSVKKNYDQR